MNGNSNSARSPADDRRIDSDLPVIDELVRGAVAGLGEASAPLYWLDAGASAALGWLGFIWALLSSPSSPSLFAGATLAFLGFYRGLGFLHEIAHLRRGQLPGFETAWNLLLGVPLLMPSVMYVGVHSAHHHPATYGTAQDPEYLPFAGDRPGIPLFVVSTALIPLGLLARFLVLSPIGLMVPRFQEWLGARASSFVMNFRYVRSCSPAELNRIRRWQAITLLFWAGALAAYWRGWLPARSPILWYGVLAAIAAANAIRALGAHRYRGQGQAMDRHEQLADSIDTPDGWWTEAWAPVGLRYHAVHHYFPGIPYHQLGKAYRRLSAALPAEAPFRRCTSRGLAASLTDLYRFEKKPKSGNRG